MTAPVYVGTRWDLTSFDPGAGLPVITRVPSLVSSQGTLDAVLVAAGKANVELRFSATGDPGNPPADPYVTESDLLAHLGTFASAAASPDTLASGAITRSASGAATAFAVVWPDGATGAFAGTESTTTPGAIDSYTVTHVLAGVTKTYTQPALTRDGTGAVSNRPAMTVS